MSKIPCKYQIKGNFWFVRDCIKKINHRKICAHLFSSLKNNKNCGRNNTYVFKNIFLKEHLGTKKNSVK